MNRPGPTLPAAFLLLLVLVLAGCGGAPAPAAPGGGSADLTITGSVDNPQGWSEEQVRAMDTMDVVATNNSGEESTYTGVSLNALLDLAGVQDGATAVTFVADDGTEAEVSLDELRACDDCILSFRNQGGFRLLLPEFPGDVQLRGITEIRVK